MSLLDDLKKEAEEKKAQEAAEKTSTTAQRDYILGTLQPKMKEVFKYFKELMDQLNVVKPDVLRTYELKGYGKLEDLQQVKYRVWTDHPETLESFSIQIDCRGEGEIEFQKSSKEMAEQQREYMWSHNLKFKAKLGGSGVGTFYLEPYVPLGFEFTMDTEKAAVRMRVKNLDALGSSIFILSPEAVNAEFLDELGKTMLGQESRFKELTGSTVSDDVRQKLREQLAKAQQAQATAAAAPAAEPEKKDSLLKRPIGKGFFGDKK